MLTRTAILAFTESGFQLAQTLAQALNGTAEQCRQPLSLAEWTSLHFAQDDGLVFVGAAGIAVRAIAPHVVSKVSDPAVVVVDECGRFAVPILSGHLGGANDLARSIAKICDAVPVLTTATDVRGVFAVDEWAKRQNCAVVHPEQIKTVSSAVLRGETIRVFSDRTIEGTPPPQVTAVSNIPCDVRVSIYDPDETVLLLVPQTAVLGIGCRKDASFEQIEEAWISFVKKTNIAPQAICCAATIDIKKDEPGLLEFCSVHGWTLDVYPAETLAKAQGEYTSSDFVRRITGVDNVCERSAVTASQGELLERKTVHNGVTMALACRPYQLDWRWQDE